MFKTLGLEGRRLVNIALLLADKSHVAPDEIVEDVLIRLGKFVILADFIILDFDVDARMPIILGHPLLDT